MPRFLHAALTPVSTADIWHAWTQHLAGKGQPEFRQAIASYLEASQAYTFTSFVRAIYACLISLKKADARTEVILPRYCCPDFTRAVLISGLKLKFCDVNPTTLSIDLKSLRELDFKNVLALICVNHLGLANCMDEVAAICRERKIYLIEDLGYALGTEYKGRKVGTFGDFSVLNFREGKAIPVGGGMTTARNDRFLDDFGKLKRSGSHLPVALAYKLFSNPVLYYFFMKTISSKAGSRYSMEDIGRNSASEFDYRFDPRQPLKSLSNFQGALGLAIFRKFEEHASARQKHAAFLEAGLSGIAGIRLIKKEPGCDHVHYIRYPVLVDEEIRNALLQEYLRCGIEASPMYPQVKPEAQEFPGAAQVSRQLLTLPCHPALNERDLEKIVLVARDFVRRRV